VSNPGAISNWVNTLPEDGRYTFTAQEVAEVTGASPAAVRMALYRLRKRGLIATPRRGFFVLVPPEYRSAGCPPASWFIDDLMRHLGRRYYVALLSAAALHGAGHQQPMAFQVITNAAERDIEEGRVRIQFHASNLIEGAATIRMQTETGTMAVATPETTAFDLVRFPGASGYWSNIATALSELAERLDPAELSAAAGRVARSDTQRLGWLLDRVGEGALAGALEAQLENKRLHPTPLSTMRSATDAPLDARWRILVNDDVEPDL